MKPIIFYGTIEEGSSTLIAQSSKEYYSIDNTFSIKVNDSGFNIQKIEKEEKWLEFKISKRHSGEVYLLIKSEQKELFKKDSIEIILKEYNSEESPTIAQSGSGYKSGEKLTIEGYGGKADINIKEVNEKGEVVSIEAVTQSSFFVNGYRSFFPEGGSGEGFEIVSEMIDSNKKTIIEKNVLNSFYTNKTGLINFEYEIPEYIESGEIKLKRTIITLDNPCDRDFSKVTMCVCQKIDYTEKLGIPLVQKGTINSYNLYNEGASIIERQFLELERRIEMLESKL